MHYVALQLLPLDPGNPGGALDCIQPTLDQLDLLLTGGRLNKSMLRAAYDEATGSDRYKAGSLAHFTVFPNPSNPFSRL